MTPPALLTGTVSVTVESAESAYSVNPDASTHSRPSPVTAFILFTSQDVSTFSSKSKKVNCIQGMLTGCPVSRLTNLNLKVVS